MPFYNKVILMGHLTRDVETKGLQGGSTVGNFGMAVNRKWKDAKGNAKDETLFVDITAWGKQAETLANYVHKGDPLFVEGRLKLDQWQDKDGGKRSKISVVLEGFQFIKSGDQHGAKQATLTQDDDTAF